jgi:hypothetical protein
MRMSRWKRAIGILLFIEALTGWGAVAYPDGGKQIPDPRPGPGKVFLYTARKLGIPFLKASIKMGNGSSEQGKPLFQIQAKVISLNAPGFLLRMNNSFTSTTEPDTGIPVRYVKEIHQEGLLIQDKHYLQTITFDYPNKKVISEKSEEKERAEFSLPPDTYDPLSIFGRYYLREELQPGQDIRISIFDGVKLRQMVFYSRKGRVTSKMYGEIEAVCLESSTSFSTFEDKEGKIRIWYTSNGEKTPVLIELELPIGDIKFELEEVREN